MLKDDIEATGRLHIVLTDSAGRVKVDRIEENLVVSVGRAYIASRMVAASANAMSHMAMGSGVVAPDLGDVSLGSELGRTPLGSATSAGAVATYASTFGPGVATGALTEAGIFNSGAGGTMLNRATFAVVNKAAGDTMTITWTVTING